MRLEREVRKSGFSKWTVSWTGEDPRINRALVEKLSQDHGFTLPNPDFEEHLSAKFFEPWLADLRRAFRECPGWHVRRFLALGYANYAKFLMYKDLDPSNWPADSRIEDKPLVGVFLGGRAVPPPALPPRGEARARVLDTDLELVLPADSTQAEVLLRAREGETLLIEGPPGTGKSQTIVNLIAMALGRGKRVLFVSEKLAALEVVFRRLEERGLRPLCLELHGERTRKAAVYEELAKTLRARDHLGRRPEATETVADNLVHLRARREELDSYVLLLNEPVGRLGEKLATVLHRAGRLELERESRGLPLFDDIGFDPLELDTGMFGTIRTELGRAERALALIGPVQQHPWRGVSSDSLLPADVGSMIREMQSWRDKTAQLTEEVREVETKYALPAARSLQEVSELCGLEGRLRRFAGKRADVDLMVDLMRTFREVLHWPDRLNSNTLHDMLRVAQICGKAPVPLLPYRTGNMFEEEADEVLKRLKEHIEDARRKTEAIHELFREGALESDPREVSIHADALETAGFFSALFGHDCRAARRFYKRHASKRGRVGASIMARHLRMLVDALDARRRAEGLAMAREYFGDLYNGVDTEVEDVVRLRDWAREVGYLDATTSDGRPLGAAVYSLKRKDIRRIAETAKEPISWFAEAAIEHASPSAASASSEAEVRRFFESLLIDSFFPERFRSVVFEQCDSHDNMIEEIRSLRALLDAYLSARQEVSKRGLDIREWSGCEADQEGLEQILGRANRALEGGSDALRDWLDYDRERRSISQAVVRRLLERAERGEIPNDALVLLFESIVFEGMARAIQKKRPEKARWTGATVEQIREAYRKLDEAVMDARSEAVLAEWATRSIPRGRSGTRISEFTELALIRHELGKKRRHLALRQLVERAGNALLTLKPCLMMSPLSVAQYLPPGKIEFDLLIMDEASQIRPEDAIGSLARANQAVITGDTKQLPPTNFFQQLDADDDDDSVLADTESIMDVAKQRLASPGVLRWHYRSRHEDLIRFSNRAFYDDELIVFPSPRGTREEYGVELHYVEDGTASDAVNKVEAKRIVEAVIAHFREQRSRSFGVVAMNIKQAQAIEDEIERMLSENLELKVVAERAREGAEPWFVKNLENVQGDERDVIYISMTYGPMHPGGAVPQRFGPINQQHGWRRLNVLFTRAREKMVVFSSMRSHDVRVDDGAARGVEALHDFLVYAESGQLPSVKVGPTGNEPESDFEIAVKNALEQRGYECVAQYGVEGYRIDIAVRDPDRPGSFLLGIECDGATYHSSQSARDRDRLRQDVLEGLGWRIERIWSTDWFYDPGRQIQRIVRALEEEKCSRRVQQTEIPHRIREPDSRLAQRQTRATEGEEAELEPAIATVEDARRALIELRENEIVPAFPDVPRAEGFLRKEMLDALLRYRPLNREEFLERIPEKLREKTHSGQFRQFADRVFQILENLEFGAGEQVVAE